MKQIITTLTLLATALTASAQGGTLHVILKDVSFLGDTILTYPNTSQKIDKQQTFTGHDGTFDFNLELDKPVEYVIMKEADKQRRSAQAVFFCAMPGEEIVITGSGNNGINIDGTRFYLEYKEVSDFKSSLAHEEGLVNQAIFSKIHQEGIDRDSLLKVYRAAMDSLQPVKEQKILDFIAAHPDLEASATLVTQMQSSAQMKKAIALLSPNVREGRAKGFYEDDLQLMENREIWKRLEAERQASGSMAPDFTLKQITGQELTLSSLRGQYVVLDFWGSWCVPCKNGMPKMKEYYQKYAGRFQIVGIACNDTDTKWRQAIAELQLPWLHVFSPKGGTVTTDFAITAFPTKIIIAPNGRIVQSFVGEGKEFYDKLDELFGS